ncbi:hypothetical protein TNCV_1514471 [Trichonephila clavipes]|nr:hypothetical protein TNCV_1514471 [Trichonephila clavipes]
MKEGCGRQNVIIVFTDESRICLQHHNGPESSLEAPWRRMLNSCVMHHWFSAGMVWGGIGCHSHSPLVCICRYFKQPALHLRGLGASCPSLPSGLGHSHISTG